MKWFIVGIGIVIVLAVVATFLGVRRHPENAANHSAGDAHGTDLLHGPNQAPAGPGAEADGVAGPGQPAPGPSAEDLSHQTARPEPED